MRPLLLACLACASLPRPAGVVVRCGDGSAMRGVIVSPLDALTSAEAARRCAE